MRSRAERVQARRLAYQESKARALHGRDADVASALDVRWRRLERRLRGLWPDVEDPRIVDVGSGSHGTVFGSGSLRAVGIDPLAVRYAQLFPASQRRVPTVAGRGEQLPFRDQAFDLAVCEDVIDRVAHPVAIVSELARVLRPGGVLYLSVHVHHPVYRMLAQVRPFAGRAIHLTSAEAGRLCDGLPLDARHQRIDRLDPLEQARHRRPRHVRHLVLRLFFKNARFELIAERR